MNTQHFILEAGAASGGGRRQELRRNEKRLRFRLPLMTLPLIWLAYLGAGPAWADKPIEVHGCGPGAIVWETSKDSWLCIYMSLPAAGMTDGVKYTRLNNNGFPRGRAGYLGTAGGGTPRERESKTTDSNKDDEARKHAKTNCLSAENMRTSKDTGSAPVFSSYFNKRSNATNYICLSQSKYLVSPDPSNDPLVWDFKQMDEYGTTVRWCHRAAKPTEGQTAPSLPSELSDQDWNCHAGSYLPDPYLGD